MWEAQLAALSEEVVEVEELQLAGLWAMWEVQLAALLVKVEEFEEVPLSDL